MRNRIQRLLRTNATLSEMDWKDHRDFCDSKTSGASLVEYCLQSTLILTHPDSLADYDHSESFRMVRPRMYNIGAAAHEWHNQMIGPLQRLAYPALRLASSEPLNKTHMLYIQIAHQPKEKDPSLAFKVRPSSVLLARSRRMNR